MSEMITGNGAPRSVEHAGLRADDMLRRQNGSLSSRDSGKRRGDEAFDALLWRLQSRQDAESAASQTIGLVGCESGAGVTTLTANLAVRASELQLGPVLLVEADMERPRLRSVWKLAPGPGLAELLAGEASYAECLRDGPAPHLHVLSAAGARRRHLPVWDPGVVDALLAEGSADHSLLLFDLPCAERMHHTVLLARRLDQVLLVARAERTRAATAQRTVDRLLDDGVALSGVVLNRQRQYIPRWLKRWV